MAHGGHPDGVHEDETGSSGDEPLRDLSYPLYEDKSDSDREDWWNRLRNDVGTPVPEYPELPPYEA